MNEISCMIVDDEPLARDILNKHIANTPGLKLVKICMNATEAYEGLYEHKPQLIFLDIQMPVITGIDFLRSLKNPPLVIFTTAYQNYAVEGFELNSVDYLMKPITYERFYQAIEKVRERMGQSQLTDLTEKPDYIFIRQDNKLVKVKFEDILYIEAQKDFSTIYTRDKKMLAGMHLKMFEEQLPGNIFMRIHRSFIINTNHINSFNGNMVEIGKTELPIGGNYKDELMKKFKLSRGSGGDSRNI